MVPEPANTSPGTFLSTLDGRNGPVCAKVCASANGVPWAMPCACQSSGVTNSSATTSVG